MEDQPQPAPPKKAGRPPKPGRRVQLHAEVSEALTQMLKQDAATHQVSVGDRLTEILAVHYSNREAMRQAS
jgi:hypothetical protein